MWQSLLARERFDVTAKAAGVPAPAEYPPMVKTMILERFKLQAHEEVRDVQAFALVRARTDGTLGPQLRRSDVDCDARRAAAKVAPRCRSQRAVRSAPAGRSREQSPRPR